MMWRGKSTRPSCQERYGKIVQHHWFGEGYLLIGFETGWVVVLSTHNREISEELHSEKMFTHGALEKMAYCSEISRAAVSCGSTAGGLMRSRIRPTLNLPLLLRVSV